MKIDPKLRERFSEDASDEEIIRTVIKLNLPDLLDSTVDITVIHLMNLPDEFVLTSNALRYGNKILKWG